MPLVRLATNIPDDKLPNDLNQAISEFLAKLFDKPIWGLIVLVEGGKKFTIGGTNEPAVMIEIKSIATYNEEANTKYANEISRFIQETLGVGNDRCVLHFFDVKPHEIAHFGTTVTELWKKNDK